MFAKAGQLAGKAQQFLPQLTETGASIAKGLGGYWGGALAYDVALQPVGSSVHKWATGEGRRSLFATMEAERERRLDALLGQAHEDQYHAAMVKSAARLAALNPHLYNEVTAGRKLPRGAVVLGGIPETDALSELTYDMASGAYDQAGQAENQLLSLLGG